MGENNTPIGLKGCGVITSLSPTYSALVMKTGPARAQKPENLTEMTVQLLSGYLDF